MTNYEYTGVTAYILNTPGMNLGFRLLGEVMFQLQPYLGIHEEDFSAYSDLLESPAFQLIQDNHAYFTNNAAAFPYATPPEYLEVSVTSHEINDQYFTRLHIPVISKNMNKEIVENGLRPALIALFGDKLANIKTKSCMDFEPWDLAEEKVLLSAQRHK